MEELIATLFLARDLAHKEHLRTKSYATHMALDSFYHDIIDKADNLAEAYQGRFGIMRNIPSMVNSVNGNIIDVLSKQLKWIGTNRSNITTESEIQNLIDEVVAVYTTTLYKLENLS